MEKPWRIVIHSSRYSGVYEGGTWFALCIGDEFPEDAIGDDVTCASFFGMFMDGIGVGNTPQDALQDLISKDRRAKYIYETHLVRVNKKKKRRDLWARELKQFAMRFSTRA